MAGSNNGSANSAPSRVESGVDRFEPSVAESPRKGLGFHTAQGPAGRGVRIGGAASRFGFTISKKTIKSSVKRNWIRRRLREAVRLVRSHVRNGYDIVLVVKQEADGVGFHDLSDELKSLLNKARLWRRER